MNDLKSLQFCGIYLCDDAGCCLFAIDALNDLGIKQYAGKKLTPEQVPCFGQRTSAVP